MDEEDALNREEERLYFALVANDVITLSRFLDEGTSVNFKFEGQNQWGKSALHLCSETGNMECASLLLEKGANAKIIDNWQQTPAMYAVCTERADMVQLLIEKNKTCINIRDR